MLQGNSILCHPVQELPIAEKEIVFQLWITHVSDQSSPLVSRTALSKHHSFESARHRA
jgi:hypothetical protein